MYILDQRVIFRTIKYIDEYSTEGFQVMQLIAFAVFGASCVLIPFLDISVKRQLLGKFDVMKTFFHCF